MPAKRTDLRRFMYGRKPTIYEVAITRNTSTENPLRIDGGIAEQEWLEVVAADDDLVLNSVPQDLKEFQLEQSWKLRSFPEGTAIYFAGGSVFIREDDSTTIEKLVEIAAQLGANVVGEDGTLFFDNGATKVSEPLGQELLAGEGSSIGAGLSPLKKKFLLEEERMRRRLACIGLFLSVPYPLFVASIVASGDNPGPGYLWAALSLGFGGLCLRAMIKPKFYLTFIGGDQIRAFLPNSKNTADGIVERSFQRSEVGPLELIWFPLEYPSKTIREYHVRSQPTPWLVFLASGSKEKCQKCLQRLAVATQLATVDKSTDDAATNIPKNYQLSASERRKR